MAWGACDYIGSQENRAVRGAGALGQDRSSCLSVFSFFPASLFLNLTWKFCAQKGSHLSPVTKGGLVNTRISRLSRLCFAVSLSAVSQCWSTQ